MLRFLVSFSPASVPLDLHTLRHRSGDELVAGFGHPPRLFGQADHRRERGHPTRRLLPLARDRPRQA